MNSSSRLSNCGTTPIRTRAKVARTGSGSPSTVILPASGRTMPRTIRAIVLLPAPFGPSRPKHSPGATANDSPLTAILSPL